MKKNYDPSTDKDYMSADMTAFFRNKIAEKLAFENKQVEELNEIALQPNNEADMYDKASIENDRSLAVIKRDRHLNSIRESQKSLVLLDNDDYGYCECGEEVGIKRLLFDPTLKKCFDCASLD